MERYYDWHGNDVTPICVDESVVCHDIGYGVCNHYKTCPNHYDGCLYEWQRMRHDEQVRRLRCQTS